MLSEDYQNRDVRRVGGLRCIPEVRRFYWKRDGFLFSFQVLLEKYKRETDTLFFFEN